MIFLYYYSKDTIEKVKIKESNYTVYEHLEKQGTRKTEYLSFIEK